MNIIEKRIAYYQKDLGAIDLYPIQFREMIIHELKWILHNLEQTHSEGTI